MACFQNVSGKYIGVNSFGFGGVNGHVILEPYIDENKDEFVQGTMFNSTADGVILPVVC